MNDGQKRQERERQVLRAISDYLARGKERTYFVPLESIAELDSTCAMVHNLRRGTPCWMRGPVAPVAYKDMVPEFSSLDAELFRRSLGVILEEE